MYCREQHFSCGGHYSSLFNWFVPQENLRTKTGESDGVLAQAKIVTRP